MRAGFRLHASCRESAGRYDGSMKTRVTLDDDVADSLREQARLLNKSFEQVVNDVLWRGLSPSIRENRKPEFDYVPISSGFQPGIDPLKLNQFNDQLEVEEFTGANAG